MSRRLTHLAYSRENSPSRRSRRCPVTHSAVTTKKKKETTKIFFSRRFLTRHIPVQTTAHRPCIASLESSSRTPLNTTQHNTKHILQCRSSVLLSFVWIVVISWITQALFPAPTSSALNARLLILNLNSRI